jgi:DNA-directed RNA polymerase specialized sigma24 family protein
MANYVDGAQGEELLLQQARRGDTVSFVAFATHWWLPISRIAWNLLGNVSEAASVAEEVLLSEFRTVRSGNVRLRVSLYRLAVRLALDRRRSVARTIGRSTHIHDALEQLQDLDRVALLLRDVEQLPAHEVAAILEATPEETRTRTHRARLRLTSLFNHIA